MNFFYMSNAKDSANTKAASFVTPTSLQSFPFVYISINFPILPISSSLPSKYKRNPLYYLLISDALWP